jgi:hypothetical protein
LHYYLGNSRFIANCRHCPKWVIPEPETTSIAQLLELATGIQADNNERIKNVNARSVVRTRTCWLDPAKLGRGVGLPIVEDITEQPASEFAAAWVCKGIFHPIDDVFHDGLDFAITSFAQCAAMNTQMLKTMGNYRFFGEASVEAKRVLCKFVQNYMAINEQLVELQLLMDGPDSVHAAAAASFAEIERLITARVAEFGIKIGVPGSKELTSIGVTRAHEELLLTWIREATSGGPRAAVCVGKPLARASARKAARALKA